MRDARTQARLRGRVGRRQTELARQLADFRLGQPGFLERGDDREFLRRLPAGTDLPGVVGVLAVGDGGEPAFARHLVEAVEKLRLAKVAAVERVAGVVGVGEFVGADDLHRRADGFCQRERVGERLPGQAGAVGDDAHGLRAERQARGGEQVGAVHPARIGDEDRRVPVEDVGEEVDLSRAYKWESEIFQSWTRRKSSSSGNCKPM